MFHFAKTLFQQLTETFRREQICRIIFPKLLNCLCKILLALIPLINTISLPGHSIFAKQDSERVINREVMFLWNVCYLYAQYSVTSDTFWRHFELKPYILRENRVNLKLNAILKWLSWKKLNFLLFRGDRNLFSYLMLYIFCIEVSFCFELWYNETD